MSLLFTADQYALVDFGGGRKLESFGPYLLDRPSPAAEAAARRCPGAWSRATARYERTDGETGVWTPADALPAMWTIAAGSLRFEVKPTAFGHLGLFPEQAPNWEWIARQVRAAPLCKVLNLFAYTGGSTLAAASAGAEVTHVDSARNVVAWARRNAALSGLSAAPIRWIVEDAATFVRREAQRGRRYDALILDPPTYGHGPKGERWRLTDDLPPLLRDAARLLGGEPRFALFTCHTPGCGPAEAEAYLADGLWGGCSAGARGGELTIESSAGGRLPCGVLARWSRGG